VDDAGRLADQDRSRWDAAEAAEAHDLLVGAPRAGPAGRYALQAAIACLHVEAASHEETDWPQVLRLYDRLLTAWPSPVVALSRSVALAEVAGPGAALGEVDELERAGSLTAYPYLPAVRADLLRRLGCDGEAATAYRAALDLTRNEAERAFLEQQLATLA
jgi:RNA polymerase sigma-70 factor (ECF subfamily)